MNIHYIFDSGKPGKNILILGSIHGDETCGSSAIEQLRFDVISGNIGELSGSITCIPYANYDAYRKNVRQIDLNLNRIFGTTEYTGEYQMARFIEKHIMSCDFLIDLHSFSSGKDPFVFNDFHSSELDTIIRQIPIQHIMTGWTELYQETTELDSIGFAKRYGKIGITIECGKNHDPVSQENAYKYILSALEALGNRTNISKRKTKKQSWIHVDTIMRKEKSGEFTRDWENFDTVKKDEIIGIYSSSNEIIKAPYDGMIIMPNAHVEIGGEWCYFGKITYKK